MGDVRDLRHVGAEEFWAAFEEVMAGEDGEHAGHRLRGRGVDAADDTVRVAAAHHHGIGLPGYVDVVGIAAFPAHELGVFGASHRLADTEFCRGQSGFDRPVVHAGGTFGCVREPGPEIKHAVRLHKNGPVVRGLRLGTTLLDFSAI